MRAGASSRGLVCLTSAVLALSGARAGAQAPPESPRASVLCVVHCDPVPPPAFERNFALLEQLVAAADATGNRLSIHWTGSYAALATQAGKTATVRGWAARGHGMGLHAHPEDVGPDGRWLPQVAWTALPQDRVEETLARATDEVNRLVTAEHNVVIDTLLPFYTSPARFPAQYTHFAQGNSGHGRPAPIVLPGGRTVTAVFYRTLPGDPTDALHVPAARLLEELATSDVAYGPVLHPGDFHGATRRELVAFFEQARARGHAPTRVADVTAPRGQDTGLRLSCAVAEGGGDGEGRVVAVHVENRGGEPVSGLTLTVYLPVDYPRLDLDRARPRPSTHDGARPAVTYAQQSYAPKRTATYLLPLSRAERPVGHPISAVVDAYLEGAGVTARWSLMTLAGTPAEGWYLPFESFAPEGAATTTVQRVAAAAPRLRLDADLAERLRRDVADRPTDASTLRDRLRLTLSVARALLEAGRQAELERILPQARFQQIEADARAGKVTEAAADLDRALLGLADLFAAHPDPPPPR